MKAFSNSSLKRLLVKGRKCSSGERTFSISHARRNNYDVVVVGGGPAGLAFASALISSNVARKTLRIALIEAGNLDRVRQWTQPDGTFSNRVSSITNVSRQFLQSINGWKHVDESRTCPVEQMQVWDGVSDSRISFTAGETEAQINPRMDNPDGSYLLQLASMTENLNLQRSLLLNLDEQNVVEIMDNTMVSSIERDSKSDDPLGGRGWPVVQTSTGKTLRARLLVGADGPNSPVRKFAGIESYGWAYDTRAIVATLFHSPRLEGLQHPNTTAYQRFLPTGPIAFLPLSPTASSLVWSTKPALASALSAAPTNTTAPGADPEILKLMINAAFRLPAITVRHLHKLILEGNEAGGSSMTAQSLQEEIRWREQSHGIEPHSAYSCFASSDDGIPPFDSETVPPLITSIQLGTVASFPLRMSHADSYVGESSRTVLIGDAAHTIHPLAGQGLNMGLADAEALANCIASVVAVGGDIGSRTALLPYARERYFENHKLLSVTDKLHKLYSTTSAPLVWARSVGLEVINELDSIKTALMISAGASSTASRSFGSTASYTVGRAVELASGAVDAAGVLGRAFARLAKTGVDRTVGSFSRSDTQR